MDFDSIKNTVSIKAGRPSWKDLRATQLTHSAGIWSGCWKESEKGERKTVEDEFF